MRHLQFYCIKIDERKSTHEIFHSNTKLTYGLDIDKVFGSRYQKVISNIKSFVSKDWIIKAIVEHSISVYKISCIVVQKGVKL